MHIMQPFCLPHHYSCYDMRTGVQPRHSRPLAPYMYYGHKESAAALILSLALYTRSAFCACPAPVLLQAGCTACFRMWCRSCCCIFLPHMHLHYTAGCMHYIILLYLYLYITKNLRELSHRGRVKISGSAVRIRAECLPLANARIIAVFRHHMIKRIHLNHPVLAPCTCMLQSLARLFYV